MSWGLGWKRPSEIFHLSLDYGDLPLSDPDSPTVDTTSDVEVDSNAYDLGFRISLDWSSADDEETAALRLESQLVVALPPPQDTVILSLNTSSGQDNGEKEIANGDGKDDDPAVITVDMKVVKRREPLKTVKVSRAVGSGQQTDGSGVLVRLIRTEKEGVPALVDHWKSVSVLSLCGCGLSAFPVELIPQLPQLEKLYLDSNRLTVLPPELGELKSLKVLRVDNNMLISVPVELRECVLLEELSLEYNKLIRPLLDFRAMSELRVLRLFGNPLEFLPEILPLKKLRHLSLANIRIEATENLKTVSVEIEDSSSYFLGAKPKLSAFFSLIFRFSSCHHPLLASALAKIMEDHDSRMVISKEESAVRQLISMVSSDNRHVVEQACIALSSLASDKSHAMQLLKCDIMQPIESVLRSTNEEELISVLKVMAILAFVSDSVAQKLLTKDVLKSLKTLYANKNSEDKGDASWVFKDRVIEEWAWNVEGEANRMWEEMENRVRKVATKVFGVTRGNKRESKDTWWWNEGVQKAIKEKNECYKCLHHHRSEDNIQKYKAVKKNAKKAVSEARSCEYEDLYQKLSTKEGEKDVYRMLHSARGRRETSTKLNALRTRMVDF